MTAHDRDIARLAALQAGHVSARQLEVLGVSPASFRHRLREGSLVLVDTCVARVAGCPRTWDGDVVAVALRLGPHAAVSHWAAAELLGLERPLRQPRIDALVSREHRHLRSRIAKVHSSSDLGRLDRVWVSRLASEVVREAALPAVLGVVSRVRVTSAARTILDVATSGTAHAVGNLVDSAMSRRLVSDAFLRRRLAAHRGSGHAGVRLLDEVMLDAGGHSWLERRFLRLVREAGLPRPRCQVVHRDGGRFIARVDFEFVPSSVIVEVSGRRGHVSESDRARDARRRNALQHAGYVVLEFVTSDVIDSPGAVAATVSAALVRSSRTS